MMEQQFPTKVAIHRLRIGCWQADNYLTSIRQRTTAKTHGGLKRFFVGFVGHVLAAA